MHPLAQGPRLPTGGNTGRNAGDLAAQRTREAAQTSSPVAGVKAGDKGETRYFQSLHSQGRGGVSWWGRPATGPGAHFGFLVRGHTEEGEKNAAVEAPLHVNDFGGRGHPLVELPGHMAQIGVQALLQGLIKDDLGQATGDSQAEPLRPEGLWGDRVGLTWKMT